MGAQKLKNGKWRFRRMVAGTWLVSRGIYPSRQAAELAEAKAVAEYVETGRVIVAPPPSEPSSGETVLDLYRRWIDWLSLHRSPRHAKEMSNLMARALAHSPDMSTLPASELTIAQVEAWAAAWAHDLTSRGKSRDDVNRWLRHSQTVWNAPWGKRRAIRALPFNPFQHVDRFSVPRTAKYVPTPAEVAALRLAAGREYRLYLDVMVETGARVSEARTLAWDQVSDDDVVLYTSKTATGGRTPRRLAIPPELAQALQAWRRTQGPGGLYVFQQDGAREPRVVTWEAKQQRRACRAADIPYFPPGCFRHYRASMWAREGVPLTTIQRRLGHSRATTTDNYLREIVGI